MGVCEGPERRHKYRVLHASNSTRSGQSLPCWRSEPSD